MPPMLTFTPRTQPDPAADAIRAHLYKLLEPSTYERLRPVQPDDPAERIPHPAEVQDAALRRYLEARNQKSRIDEAFAVEAEPVIADAIEGVA